MNTFANKAFYNTTDLCDIFSISKATVNNWIKLKKITPDKIIDNKPYFSAIYIEKFLNSIKSNHSERLKSRRNKTFVNGSFFYKDYISENSKNLKIVQSLLDHISSNNIALSEEKIKYIIANYAIQMYFESKNISTNGLLDYLQTNETNVDTCFAQLIKDITPNKNNAIDFIKNNSEIFNYKFVYEQNEDILGLLYLSLSDISVRKARGAYFTPTKIAKKIIANIKFTAENILDPCCGTGNFLLQLPIDINLKNIHGTDIDSTSIKITRINMALKYQTKNINLLRKNFTVSDFLKNEISNSYKYIIGNPPWGYKFSKEEISNIKKNYYTANGKNIESFDIFVEKALSTLPRLGILSFVLPEAILSVKKHKPVRELILNSTSFSYLEYLGNMFDKVQCPSIILQLKKERKTFPTYKMKIKFQNQKFTINTKREISSEVFNFNLNDKEYLIYKKITNLPNRVYLQNNGNFALGIVTGDNKQYISNIQKDGLEPIIKGSDISKYKLDSARNFIKFEPDKYQQIAPLEYYKTSEKLFYKFISNKLIFAYDNQQMLSLNSCNILIPKFKDLHIKYIMAVLNSSVAQFFFQKKYNSIKVLRSHLESIPIPKCDLNYQNHIIKLVDEILITSKKTSVEKLINEIDLLISKLYNITTDEYSLIKAVLT